MSRDDQSTISDDARNFSRHVVDPPILARFGDMDIHIVEFSIQGFRALHDEALVPGHRAKALCVVPPVAENFRFEAEVLWCHPSIDARSHFRFVSGFLMDRDRVRALMALERLLASGRATES